MVHQGLIRIEIAPDGSFVFYDKGGRVIPEHGEPPRLPSKRDIVPPISLITVPTQRGRRFLVAGTTA